MPAGRAITLNEMAAALGDSGHLLAGPQPPAGSLEISSLAYDSRRVQSGGLFCCVPGFGTDGHDFASGAVARGAVALVVERHLGLGVPELRVDSVRAAMGPLAARFYDDPSAALRLVGVTGTNGKTTTAFLVRELLERAGVRCGLMGTVKSVIGGTEEPLSRTTPEAIDLQAHLRAMLDAGDAACAMEVSSHALALGRADGLRFAVSIFTNLTQDHLDFHVDMEDYFQAKRRLFVAGPTVGVINVADPYGARLAAELDDAVTFAVADESIAEADYLATDVRCGVDGSRFVLRTPEGSREVVLPAPGRFNVANGLAALAAVRVLGVELDLAVTALSTPVRVPGRFESVDEGQDFAVLVDYAHTPDSLGRVLAAARELASARARVVCVFGAGGDRDRGKRPLMGQEGARGADVLIVTSDNPRSEDPEQIIAEIMAGVREAERTLATAAKPSAVTDISVVADRKQAISRAIEVAQPGDVVVIAGKGHEQGQEFAGGRVLPFDDIAVARTALRGLPVGAG